MKFLLWSYIIMCCIFLTRKETGSMSTEYTPPPNITTLSKEDLSIIDTYLCPKDCSCRFYTDPDRVDVACQLKISLDERFVDFSIFNRTTFPSRLILICDKDKYFTSRISDGIFESLQAFYYIKIKDCQLTSVSRYAFKGMESLKVLNIEGGKNTQFDSDCFQLPELSNLEVVSVTDSGLKSVPSLCNHDNLWHVNLSRNSIETFADTGLICERPSNIECIEVSFNKLRDVPDKFGTITNKLKRLSASNNMISHIAGTIFDNLTELEVLDLSDNRIFPFPDGFLGNNSGIHTLQLAGNTVGQLPKGVFALLENVTLLNLNDMSLNDDIWLEMHKLSALQVLLLNDNDVTFLHDIIIRQFKNLGILDISWNSIVDIPNGIFASNNQLISLNIANNRITSINKDSFAGLQNLSKLDLKYNEIYHIHHSALSHLSSLVQLNMSYNSIKQLPEFPRSMVILDLRGNNLTEIDSHAFDGLADLAGINLMSNYLQYLPNDLFKTNTRLQFLHLAKNSLTTLDYHIFPPLSQVEVIILHHNNFTEVVSLPDEYFPRLKTLDLGNNKIKNVVQSISGNLFPTSIEEIILLANKIIFIDNYLFALPHLKYVDLRMNEISNLSRLALAVTPGKNIPVVYSLFGNPFNCDCKLAWLKIVSTLQHDIADAQYIIRDFNYLFCFQVYRQNGGLMKNIPADNFLCKYKENCFPRCSCCDLDDCPCRTYCPVNCTCYHSLNWMDSDVIDCQNSGLMSVPLNMSATVTTLDLSGNYFPSISSSNFKGLTLLRELHINSSHIVIIKNGSFAEFANLTLLNLGYNFLSSLQPEMFQGLQNLRTLTLSFNKISEIQDSTFDALKHLSHLDLSGNKLKTVSSFVFKSLSKILTLTLSKNPWSCECKYLEKMKNFTLTYAKRITDFANLVCMMHNTSSNMSMHYPLADVNLPDFCRNDTVIYNQTNTLSDALGSAAIAAMSTVLSVCTIGLILFAILFWHRQFLKVWCFVKFGWKFDHGADDDEANRPYDAFVSYSCHDEAFVVRELLPYLEAERQGRQPYRLCVHFRDFPVGGAIAETILSAVECSRRVIILLSDNFLNSEWCQYEFQAAHHQLLEERKNRIIMVLLHDINMDMEDQELKDFLKTRTYLKYGDPWFWPKLEYAMPKLPRTNTDNVGAAAAAPQPDVIPNQIREGEAQFPGDDEHNDDMQYIIDNMKNFEADDPKQYVFEMEICE